MLIHDKISEVVYWVEKTDWAVSAEILQVQINADCLYANAAGLTNIYTKQKKFVLISELKPVLWHICGKIAGYVMNYWCRRTP